MRACLGFRDAVALHIPTLRYRMNVLETDGQVYVSDSPNTWYVQYSSTVL